MLIDRYLPTRRPNELRLSALIVALAVPAHVIGLLHPSIYRDPAIVLPQNLGTDVVTLAVGIPLLAVSALAMWRGSLRARLLWLGALGFMTYDYGMYALGVRWNPLFLVYLALFGLSLFALIIGLVGTDVGRIRASFTGRPPVRSAAGLLIAVAVIVAAMWLAEELGSLVKGTVPPSVLQFEASTNIVHVFDLGIVLPAMVVVAVQLLRDRPWGFVLAPVLLVKAATIGLWVVAMMWFSGRQGYAVPVWYALVFVALTAISGALAWWFLAGLEQPVPGGDVAAPEGRHAATHAQPMGG